MFDSSQLISMRPASKERGHVVINTMVNCNPALCMAEGLVSLASPSPSCITTAQRGAGQCPVWGEPSKTVPSNVAMPLATCGYLNLNSLKLKVGFSVTLAISQGLRDTMCLVTTTLDSIDTEYFYHPSKFYLTHWSGIFLSQHNSNPPSQWIT